MFILKGHRKKFQHSFWEAGSTLSVGVHRAAELHGSSWIEKRDSNMLWSCFD